MLDLDDDNARTPGVILTFKSEFKGTLTPGMTL